MVRNIILLSAILLFAGCSYSSPYRPTKPNEVIKNETISFLSPGDDWKIDKEYGTLQYKNWDPAIYKDYNGFSYEIDFRTYPYRDGVVNRQLFDKDSLIDDSDIMPVVYDEIDKEQGIKYARGWVPYIKGMRCAGGVFSRSFGGTAYSATSKNYSIGCGYYDKQGGKRLLEISYRYYGGTGDTELQTDKDDNTKEKHLTPQEAETELKQALKEVLKTLKLKNFDKEKMIKEGLYHPNKEFESTKW
jgi:hypothetical protein